MISIVLPYLSNSRCIDICKKYIEQNTVNPYEIIEIIDITYNNFKRNNGDDVSMPLSFFGGEPFIAWKTIQKCIEHAKEKDYRLSVGITTNLTLLNDEQIDFIEERDGHISAFEFKWNSRGKNKIPNIFLFSFSV